MMQSVDQVSIPSKNSNFKFCHYFPTIPVGFLKVDVSIEKNKISQGGHKLVKKLTIDYFKTLVRCNPSLKRSTFQIPQRDLTFPNIGIFNDNYDNEENEYILRVHDSIVNTKKNETYIIEDLIGKGTFGQVIKCYREGEDKLYAIKIIKNLKVYNFQALQEIKILRTMNLFEEQNPQKQSRIVKLIDQFIFRNHVCLVFPLHHISLFDFLQETKFEGLQMDLIRNVIRETLEGTLKLHQHNIIHCDLKPENILLSSKDDHSAKIIDLGSALPEDAPYYGYIQSLFYRAPEIFLGNNKTPQIDMWSIGCIAVELYLGQPLFAGLSSLDQLTRMIKLIKFDYQLVYQSQQWQKYFTLDGEDLRIKTLHEYQQDEQSLLTPFNKSLYGFSNFDDLRHEFDKSTFRTPDQTVHLNNFIDFVQSILKFNPASRLTPAQALLHPFINEEKSTFSFEKMLSSQKKKPSEALEGSKANKKKLTLSRQNNTNPQYSKSMVTFSPDKDRYYQKEKQYQSENKTSKLSLNVNFKDYQNVEIIVYQLEWD